MKRKLSEEPLYARLAFVAEKEGMWVADVARFPDILKKWKLPDAISGAVVHQAHQAHRERVNSLVSRVNRLSTRPEPSKEIIEPKPFPGEITVQFNGTPHKCILLKDHGLGTIDVQRISDGNCFRVTGLACRDRVTPPPVEKIAGMRPGLVVQYLASELDWPSKRIKSFLQGQGIELTDAFIRSRIVASLDDEVALTNKQRTDLDKLIKKGK